MKEALSIESNQTDARYKNQEDGTVQTLLGRMGTGGNNVPMALAYDGSETAPTLTASNAGGEQRMPDKGNFNAVIGVDAYNQASTGDVSKSLNSAATDSDHIPCVTTKGDNYARTQNEVLCLLWQTYGEKEIEEWGTNVLASLQQAEVLRQGVYEESFQDETESGNELDDSALPRPSTVAEWLLRDMRKREECGCSSQGRQSSEQRDEQSTETLQELSHKATPSAQDLFNMWRQGKGVWLLQQALHTLQEIRRSALCQEQQYIVRRLTPLEAERLQGFPDKWTDIGEWTDTKGKVHQTTDSARYKALGNSIAVGFANEQRGYWMWLLKRISAQFERSATMGSLFDGISGFPLAWATYNGPKNCLWSSEIEEFCIAVCKRHFGDEETGEEGDIYEYLKEYMG